MHNFSSLLEDLIVAAVNSAARKADESQKSNAPSMLGGLGLPAGICGYVYLWIAPGEPD